MDYFSLQLFSHDHPLISHDFRTKVGVQPLYLTYYAHEEVYNRSIRPSTKICNALDLYFYHHTFDCAHGIMNVYFSAAVYPAGVWSATVVHHLDGKKVPKDDCCMVMIDNGHLHHSLKTVRGAEPLAWAAVPLRIQYAFHIHRKLMNPAQVIMESKISNVSATIKLQEIRFAEAIHRVLNYEPAYVELCAVRFVEAAFWTSLTI